MPSAPAAQSQSVRFSDIQPELEANVSALSGNIEQFEAIQRPKVDDFENYLFVVLKMLTD